VSEDTDARDERQREIDEEREYEQRYRGASAYPQLGSEQFVTHTAKTVRDWVRSVLVPPAVKRMFDIGMGIEKFQQPTAAGNVVTIEAPPMVQQRALAVLISVGVPTQMGLVDNDGNTLPGVFALPGLELDAARQEAHGERYMPPEHYAAVRAAVTAGDPAASAALEDAPPATQRPMEERIEAGEFTLVEVDEGVGMNVSRDEDVAPGAIVPEETPAQLALRRHRERMNGKRPTGWQNTRPTPPQSPED
jgi:hypothetical protein